MQEQDIKKGNYKKLEGDGLKNIMVDIFGTPVTVQGEKHIINYGALRPLTVWIKDKGCLCVETTMNTDVDTETADKTIKLYNNFLETTTGFNAKQRKKRLSDKMKKDEKGA